MPPPKTDPNATPRMAKIHGLEIFATGEHKDKDFTDEDLDEIVDNFNKLGPGGKNILQPPAVLGHEENQELLDRSDLPAAGWPKRSCAKAKQFMVPRLAQTASR